MKPRNEEHRSTEGRSKAKKPRFQIEKLEERIAPKKGGIPGSPDHAGQKGGPNYCRRYDYRDHRCL